MKYGGGGFEGILEVLEEYGNSTLGGQGIFRSDLCSGMTTVCAHGTIYSAEDSNSGHDSTAAYIVYICILSLHIYRRFYF